MALRLKKTTKKQLKKTTKNLFYFKGFVITLTVYCSKNITFLKHTEKQKVYNFLVFFFLFMHIIHAPYIIGHITSAVVVKKGKTFNPNECPRLHRVPRIILNHKDKHHSNALTWLHDRAPKADKNIRKMNEVPVCYHWREQPFSVERIDGKGQGSRLRIVIKR